ncbi:MAG: hypothetical protein FWE84_04525 [Firmicutes bacterium]|nr:hypothetical protein [Bacillota bacterium]
MKKLTMFVVVVLFALSFILAACPNIPDEKISGDNNNETVIEYGYPVSLFKYNFETYFNVSVNSRVTGAYSREVSYTITPKSAAYAKHSKSDSSISVRIVIFGSGNNQSIYVVLSKSSGYHASGKNTITVKNYESSIYFDIDSTSGTIYV